MGLDLDLGVKLLRNLFCDLSSSSSVQPRSQSFTVIFIAYQSFRLLDVFVSEEKLPVEVTQVDGVEVDDVDVTKTEEDDVFEEFATDATGTDHEDSRLQAS